MRLKDQQDGFGIIKILIIVAIMIAGWAIINRVTEDPNVRNAIDKAQDTVDKAQDAKQKVDDIVN